MSSTKTLIDLINDVLISTRQRGNKTSIQEQDSTQYIALAINDAFEWIYRYYPTQVDNDGTFAVQPSIRTYTVPGLDVQRIYDWSWILRRPDGSNLLRYATKQTVVTGNTDYQTTYGEPSIVYIDNGKVALFPVPPADFSGSSVQFTYPAQYATFTDPLSVFPFENGSDELRFVKLYAKHQYQMEKGLGQPDATLMELEQLRAQVIAKYRGTRRNGYKEHRIYGQ